MSGKCVSLVARKGGASKTTTCCILAGSIASRGHKVAVIDADYNHSLANWVEKFDVPVELHRPVTNDGEIDDQQIFALARDLKERHELVVIDTAGAASRAAVFAMAQSDLVIIPMMLSEADVVEAVNTFELVDEVRKEIKHPLEARGLLSAYTPRTAIASYVTEQIAELKLPMLRTKLQHLTAFKEMSWNGKVPSRWQAGQQVRWFLEELSELDVLPFLNMREFGAWWKISA